MSKKEKQTVFNILDNTLDWYYTDEAYEEYKDWCEMNNIEPDEKDSANFWDWANDNINLSVECDLDNMAYSKIKGRMFVITGSVQLWNRRPTIKPVFIRGLVDTVKKLSGSGDRHFKIELDTEKGIITARQWSHDDPMGNTMLEARMLNKNGEKWFAAAEERYEADEIEINNRWWSKITDIGMIY
jgi:hypothetical protein